MTLDERNEFLRSLTASDFRELGNNNVVYIRETEYRGATHYAVNTADGQTLSLATSLDNAINAIQASDFDPVTLH